MLLVSGTAAFCRDERLGLTNFHIVQPSLLTASLGPAIETVVPSLNGLATAELMFHASAHVERIQREWAALL